jgi:hypothetical protein
MIETATELAALGQILLIDVALAGDNAITIGMAAAGLPAQQRHRAVFAGIAAATVLRIVFAIFAVELLHITGLLLAGGLLLLWVSWKMYHDIRHHNRIHQPATEDKVDKHQPKTLRSAIIQIILADVSMSLDNVLAVAGVARDHIFMLVVGLGVSVVLMGAASAIIAKLTTRFPWIAFAGLLIVLYTAFKMVWDGAHQLNLI